MRSLRDFNALSFQVSKCFFLAQCFNLPQKPAIIAYCMLCAFDHSVFYKLYKTTSIIFNGTGYFELPTKLVRFIEFQSKLLILFIFYQDIHYDNIDKLLVCFLNKCLQMMKIYPQLDLTYQHQYIQNQVPQKKVFLILNR